MKKLTAVSRSLLRLRNTRRDPATLIGEIADGIVPATLTPADPLPKHGSHYRRTALIVATGLFMQNLDATVLATALPTVARDFGVPPPSISQALTSYLLALAIFIPASGYAADRFGARGIFQAAIALFAAGSLACGLSTSLQMLIVARFVQGMGGAMMVPVGRLLLLRSVEKRDLVSAISWLTMPAMIGPILGPPVGGAIVTYLDWRWIFWINLPMGAAGIALIRRYIADTPPEGRAMFDAAGFVYCGVALSTLLFGLQLSTEAGRGPVALALLAVGVVMSTLYLRHARRSRAPLLDPSLLGIPTFRLSVLGGTLIRVTQGAQPFLLPMMLQLSFGLSAAASGGIMVAMAAGGFAMKGVARPLLKRLGFRNTLTVVGVLAPLSYAVTGLFRPGWPVVALAGVLLVCGFLSSLQFTAYNTIAYADVEQGRMSRATSFYATFQQLSMSLGVCIAAGALTLAMRWKGDTDPQFADFSVAIWTVAAISLCAIVINMRFAGDAGAELSGQHVGR